MTAVLSGCASTTRYHFDVRVKNTTSQPITIGFTKTGPPVESQWASPENLTNLPPSRQPAHWGEMLPPGKSVSYEIHGEFYKGIYGVLRVYAGDPPLAELLAISRGNAARIDLMLEPGNRNNFIIDDSTGKLRGKLIRAEPR